MAELLQGVSIDWTECSLVEVNARKVSGAPVLRGSRMPADGIVENYVGGSPVEEISYNFDIPPATIIALLRYAAERNPAIRI